MQIEIESLSQLEHPGVYKILNTVNKRHYIGSTKQKIRLRLNHHLQALRNNKHKNTHLQRAWNKYGEKNFKFIILENCSKDIVYNREQFYLDNRDVNLSYNINPMATGFSTALETQEKLKLKRSVFNQECSQYYKKLKQSLITLDDIPLQFIPTIEAHLNNIPWNKGKHYKSTDHLKVKHKITEKVIKKGQDFSETFRNNADIIYVYDLNWNFIDRFRSAIDLANMSKLLNLPIHSRFSKARGRCAINELQSCNINRAVKISKPYKGLYFTKVPIHQGIDEMNEPKSVNSVMKIPR